MNALGFGRSEGEASPVETATESQTKPEATSESKVSGRELPIGGSGESAVPPTFEPLPNEGEMKEDEAKAGEPSDESESMAQEEEPDEADACDADGVAMRGDDAGPDFLASEEEGEEVDDWESELMVGDDFEAIKAATTSDSWKSASASPEPTAAFPWLRASLDAGGESVVDAEAADAVDEPLNFESKADGENLLPKSKWTSYLGDGDLPVDGESISALSMGLTKNPELPTQKKVGAPKVKEPETDALDGLLLDDPDEKPLVASWPMGGIGDTTVPLDALPGDEPESQPQSQPNPEPVMPNSESSPEPSPEFPMDEKISSPQEEDLLDLEADLLLPEPHVASPDQREEDPTPATSEPVVDQPEPESGLPWHSEADASSSDPADPAEDPAPDASAPDEPIQAGQEPESKTLVAAAVMSEEVIDLACPECGDGLSLRREHLGIAGHCVWCQAPLIAAASGLDGVVRVFLLKIDSESVEVKPEEAGSEPDPEISEAEIPIKEKVEAENPLTVAASPWIESPSTQPVADSPSEAPQPTTESISAETRETSEPVLPLVEEVDPKAALLAERAAAVQQALTGAVKRQNPEPKADAEEVAKPSSTESRSAFDWANPNSSEEVDFEKKEDDKESSESSVIAETEDAAKKPGSPFDWKPPVSSPVDATSEAEEKAGSPSLANQPFGELGNAASLASSMTLKNKLSSNESEDKSASYPDEEAAPEVESFQNLSKFLSDPTSAPKAFSLMSEPEQSAPDASKTKAAEKTTDTWADQDEKAKSDPFGGGFGEVDNQESDEPESADQLASESRVESKDKPARVSLFTNEAATAPKEKEPSVNEEEPEISKKEGETAPEKKFSKEIPAAKSEVAAPAPAKPTKDKIKREVDTSAPASKGKGMGRLVKMALWALVVLGLISGAGAMAMYRDQIKAKLMPILEKVIPSKVEIDDKDAAEVAVPMAEPSSASSSDPKSSTTSDVSPATADSEASHSSTSPTINTGHLTIPVAPEIVPEKKSLFGGGPLLINDNGGGSDSSE